MVKKHYIWALCLAPLYVIFLAIDIFASGGQDVSSALKYASIWACFAYAVYTAHSARSKLLPAAMAFTVAADTGLLFGLPPAPFVGLFIVAQALHTLRMSGARRLCATAAAALVFGLAAQLTYDDMLMSVSAAYAVFLLANLFWAILRRGRPGGGLAVLGFALFVCCDCCVALHNAARLPYDTGRVVAALMWTFYLPSQVLIVISSSLSARRG